ncbi:MAG: BspA family leucine-rich repeat surface protein, partial [Streptococcaceae bacterium]|nr:BspA family leucine-rich repeat surface protein [Streptococcaceae bacterium]
MKSKKDKLSKKQRNLIKAGTLLAIGSGAFIANAGNHPLSSSNNQTSQMDKDSLLLNNEKQKNNEQLKNLSNEENQVKNYAMNKVATLPNDQELQAKYGTNISISKVKTSYDLNKLRQEAKGDTYYTVHAYSQTPADVMKMSGYKKLMASNKNVDVEQTQEYKIVSSHLYSSKEMALEDSANWKDSKVVESTRLKQVGAIDSIQKASTMNFRADDGALLTGLAMNMNVQIAVKGNSTSAPLTNEIKSDFEDTIEKNVSINYQGRTYHAVYHEGQTKIDHNQSTIDGYFTFAESTHALPLQVNNHFLVIGVQYGQTIGSLTDALSVHGVTSYENTTSWLSNKASPMQVTIQMKEHLADENATFYQIQAQKQVIRSLNYQSIEVSTPQKVGSDVVYAAQVTPSTTYKPFAANLGFSVNAGYIWDSVTGTFTVGSMDGNPITWTPQPAYANPGTSTLRTSAFLETLKVNENPLASPDSIQNFVVANPLTVSGNLDYAFADMRVSSVSGMQNIQLNNITSMDHTFSNFGSITTSVSDISPIMTWDTSQVTDMTSTFNNSGWLSLDLNAWNTSNVTTLDSTFANSQADFVGIGSWDTSNVS